MECLISLWNIKDTNQQVLIQFLRASVYGKYIYIFTEFTHVFSPLKMQMPQLIFKILGKERKPYLESGRKNMATHKK